MSKQVTLGSDPESHILRLADNKIINSIPVIKADKHTQRDLGEGVRLYSDSVLAEAAFPPSYSIEEFVSRLRDTYQRIHKFLGPKYQLVHKAAHLYGEEEVGPKPEKMTGELPVSWEIGCVPAWNCYSKMCTCPAPFADGTRTGSFHLHIGHPLLEADDMDVKGLMVRLLDIFVGCSSVLFDKDPTSKERRRLYGEAGQFRPTAYGCEYRVLSNYALNSPSLVKLVWDLALHAVKHLEDGTAEQVIQSVSPEKVQLAINGCERELCISILERAALPWDLERKLFIAANATLKPWQEAWGI